MTPENTDGSGAFSMPILLSKTFDNRGAESPKNPSGKKAIDRPRSELVIAMTSIDGAQALAHLKIASILSLEQLITKERTLKVINVEIRLRIVKSMLSPACWHLIWTSSEHDRRIISSCQG